MFERFTAIQVMAMITLYIITMITYFVLLILVLMKIIFPIQIVY